MAVKQVATLYFSGVSQPSCLFTYCIDLHFFCRFPRRLSTSAIKHLMSDGNSKHSPLFFGLKLSQAKVC
jgi:hypothetical protein